MSAPGLPAAPGTYLLVLTAFAETRLRVGSLGEMMVHPGFYLYVGSAFGPGGLRARVGRHIAGSGPLRWHIDYLRRGAQPVAAWCAPDQRCEHEWAQTLAAAVRVSVPLARFGASDCRCPAHLFFLKRDLDSAWLLEYLQTGVCSTREIVVISAFD